VNKTVDVTTPSEQEILVTRAFDAPAQLVFDFHTKPEHVRKWLLGPPGWSMPVCTIDLKVGGRYEYVWRSDEDGNQFGVQGEFREIAKPARLVHTERMDGAPGEALCTLAFEESADGKTTLRTLMHFSTKEARDMALESGMTDGMAASYDRLEEYLRTTNAGA
jgi:uncharacterized protein YndB with AHSA1/START domain